MIYAVRQGTKAHRIIDSANSPISAYEAVVKADANGWIDWSGENEDSPLPNGSLCDYITRDAKQHLAGDADIMRWLHSGVCYSRIYDVIAYRPILDQPASEEPVGWGGEGSPPVGLRVEYTSIEQDAKAAIIPGKWYGGKIIAYHDGYVWTSDNGIRRVANTKFRPIRTDREQWIEAAEDYLDGNAQAYLTEIQLSSVANTLYDALSSGELPTPEQTK